MHQYHCRYFMLHISVLSVYSAHNKYIDVREKVHLQEENRVGHCVAPVQSKIHN